MTLPPARPADPAGPAAHCQGDRSSAGWQPLPRPQSAVAAPCQPRCSGGRHSGRRSCPWRVRGARRH